MENELNNFQKVNRKLNEVGAILINTTTVDDGKTDFYSPMIVQFWQVNQRGLIVCGYENGGCGLYQFVGTNGDDVEKDLKFIDEYSSEEHDHDGFQECRL